MFRLLLDHISVSRNGIIYYQTCSFYIITDYNVRFIVRNDSVVFHFLSKKFGYFLIFLLLLRLIIIIIIIIINVIRQACY